MSPKFQIFGTSRRMFCWRQSGEPLQDDCIQKTVKHGCGSVIVFGGFSGGRTGVLYQIEGITTKDLYIKILLKVAIPDATRLYSKGFVFQQDNDSKHTVIIVKDALKEKEKQKVLKVMAWLPQSPDLNLIELCWAKLESGY